MTEQRCSECYGLGWIYLPAVEHGDRVPADYAPCKCNPRALGDPWLGMLPDEDPAGWGPPARRRAEEPVHALADEDEPF